jgi:hypothetical protein
MNKKTKNLDDSKKLKIIFSKFFKSNKTKQKNNTRTRRSRKLKQLISDLSFVKQQPNKTLQQKQ